MNQLGEISPIRQKTDKNNKNPETKDQKKLLINNMVQ